MTALLDSAGAVVVKYAYDAWGGHKVEVKNADYAELAEKNPILCRGYYCGPETGRFVSQDGLEYADPESLNG